MTQARAHIAAMAPYALANLSVPGHADPISLSQNESFRPPSPEAITAGIAALAKAPLYPDPDSSSLRAALADLHFLDPNTIVFGNGSLDLISVVARTFAGPNRSVLAPAHAYPFFRTVARMSEARFDAAAEEDMTVSVDALLEQVKDDTGLCFVANPGNPTGTRIPKTELLRLRAGLPNDVLLVIDEAYGEFADDLGERTFDMVSSGNTIVLRTFSKAYGLAGCRVGWGVFPPHVAEEIKKVINPNALTSVSEAMAIGALGDQDYMVETCVQTIEMRKEIATELETFEYRCLPSHTNFVLIDLATTETASKLDGALKEKGILLRPQGGAGLPHCLRFTVGPEAHNKAALDLFEAFQSKVRT